MQGMRVEARNLPLHMQEQVALSFLNIKDQFAHGRGGDCNSAHWACEKGRRERIAEVVGLIMEVKTQANGEQHELLKEMISKVKKLE